MRIGALTLMLTLGTVSAAAEDVAPYSVRACGQWTTQLDLKEFARANLQAADAVLNKVYQQVMTQQGNALSKHQVKHVQRAWIDRDKECAFEVGLSRTAARSGRWR